MDFCLNKDTVCINIFDPISNEITKKIVFFGIIPDDIKVIIDNRDFKKESSVKKLEKYFGKSWKQKFHIDTRTTSIKAQASSLNWVNKNSQASSLNKNKKIKAGQASSLNQTKNIKAGALFDIDFENIEQELQNLQKVEDNVENVQLEEYITYVTKYILYPETTIWELKQKLYLISKIPTYRQCFYIKTGKNYKFDHKLFISDIEYKINFKNDIESFYNINIITKKI